MNIRKLELREFGDPKLLVSCSDIIDLAKETIKLFKVEYPVKVSFPCAIDIIKEHTPWIDLLNNNQTIMHNNYDELALLSQ